jgi:4-amino-4-deoxy-L-arabinose transferase-like glycosyltransferase
MNARTDSPNLPDFAGARKRALRLHDLLALLSACALIGLFLWSGSLPPDNDALYADVAREMLRSGDWLNPTVHGVPFLDKPPLFFWLSAITESLLGSSVFALRLPAALCGALGAALVYHAGASKSRFSGALSCLLVLSMPLYFEYSRRVYMEVPVAVAVFASLLAFARAGEALRNDVLDKRAFMIAGVLVGVGFMLKSLVGLFGAIGFCAWLVLALRARILSRNVLVGGVIALGSALLVAAPWHVYQLATQQELFLEFTWKLHVKDQLLAAQPWSTGPAWFYLELMATKAPLLGVCMVAGLGFAGWSLFGTRAEPDASGEGRLSTLDGLLAVSMITTLALLSASETKKDLYLIPLAPMAATLAGRSAAQLAAGLVRRLVLGAAVLAALPLVVWIDPEGEFMQGAAVEVPAARAVRDHSQADELVHVVDFYFVTFQYYAERRTVSEWTSPSPAQLTGRIPYIHHGDNMRHVAPTELPRRVLNGELWVLPKRLAQQLLPAVQGQVSVLHAGALVVLRAKPR